MFLTEYHNFVKKSIAMILAVVFSFMGTGVYARAPNDTEFQLQASMWNQINAPAAWDIATGSRQVTVAIIDTGVDIEHEDLRDNIWRNPGEVEANGIDDDRNGYVDDIHGWNFVENNNDVRTSVTGPLTDDREAINHGTIVAGLIGAKGDNGRNGVGVNWEVRIMPIRAIANDGSGSFYDVGRALEYAMQNGAKVVSMSFVGTSFNEDLMQTMRRAYERGVVIVTAAGNDAQLGAGNLDEEPRYPICYDRKDSANWILGVTSVNSFDILSSFSDFGGCVDISAPGEQIFSTERYAPEYGYSRAFGGAWRGTSFAVPLVAGAAALLASYRPDLGPNEIIQMLLDTSDSLNSANAGKSSLMGRGRLNIGRALTLAAETAPMVYDFQSLYYAEGNKIWKYSLSEATREVVSAFSDATIVDLIAVDIDNDSSPELLTLLRRDSFYYVRILYTSTGDRQEFSIDDPALSAPRISHDMRIAVNGAGEKKLVVRQTDRRQTRTFFVEFDFLGGKIRETSVSGRVAKWSVSRTENMIIATLQNRNMLTREVDWQGRVARRKVMRGVTGIYAMENGPVWSAEGSGQIAVVLSRQRNLVYTVIDLPSDSWSEEVIGKILPNMSWNLAFARTRTSRIAPALRYSSRGGTFVAMGAGEETGQQIQLPAIRSQKLAVW